MKNGLIEENGALIYYKDDVPHHVGLIRVGEEIYYITKGGVPVKGKHLVHSAMTNGILKHGYYTFGEDGKLIAGSYVPLKRKKRKKKRTKHPFSLKNLRRAIRHNRKKIRKGMLIYFAMLLVVSLAIDATLKVVSNSDRDDGGAGNKHEESFPVVDLPDNGTEYLLCSYGALECYFGNLTVWAARAYGNVYVPVKFEYDLKGRAGTLIYSENEDMSGATSIPMNKDEKFVLIDNLKTGTTYYYEVQMGEYRYHGHFKTAVSTRFISVDGLLNARDIGGYTTLDGKTVKQGMIIRGAEIDGLVEPTYCLTQENLNYMRNTFKFVFDMDLRADALYSGDYSSYLGNDVKHQFYSAPGYGSIFDAKYKEQLRQIFADFASERNYPMYVHCTYGADRTGTVIFLLQGVLNMSEEEMVREFQRTGFTFSKYSTTEKDNCNEIIDGLQSQPGDTLQEKIVNFLIYDIGVTPEEIEAIRNILLQ